MTEGLHRLFFSRLQDPPPAGNIQFYDGFFPALPAGPYTIGVTHAVTAPTGTNPSYTITQAFRVLAPEFQLDPNTVESAVPADGTTAVLDQMVPTVVLSDPSLPWERSLVPDTPPPKVGEPLPWLALLLFAEGEVILQPNSSSPLITSSVQDLLATNTDILKPTLPVGWVADDVLASQCQSIVVRGAAWPVMPSKDDLPYMAHCRITNVANEDPGLVSVLLGNRLPLAAGSAPLRYYAHVVSLEGFADYLEPNAKPLPEKPGGGPVDVQMCSLANYTFTALPEAGLSFEELMKGLISSEVATPLLRLPGGTGQVAAGSVEDRLAQGYVPLTLDSLSGEQSFAWYRGPLSAVVPQPLPPVGNPPVPVTQAKSADALMIYVQEQGLFDLSYAAAWNMGRQLALANAGFAKALNRYHRQAVTALNTIAQKRALPLTAGETPAAMLAHGASKRAFARAVGQGLARNWDSAMKGIGGTPAKAQFVHGNASVARKRVRGLVKPLALLKEPGVVEAISAKLGDPADPVAEWLASLANLIPVPFSSLVADGRMLPAESIRFFYIDPGWIDALLAGALSLARQTSLGSAVTDALTPGLRQRALARQRATLRRSFEAAHLETESAGVGDVPLPTVAVSGVLIRSAMVSGWPGMAISGTAAGAPVDVVRDATLAPSIRLVLFAGTPDTLTLAKPYQGLQFGVEDNGIVPRYVTSAGQIGKQIPGIPPVPPGGYEEFLKVYTRTASGSVIQMKALATALATATSDPTGFGPGDFAMQMVFSPEMQQFTPVTG